MYAPPGHQPEIPHDHVRDVDFGCQGHHLHTHWFWLGPLCSIHYPGKGWRRGRGIYILRFFSVKLSLWSVLFGHRVTKPASAPHLGLLLLEVLVLREKTTELNRANQAILSRCWSVEQKWHIYLSGFLSQSHSLQVRAAKTSKTSGNWWGQSLQTTKGKGWEPNKCYWAQLLDNLENCHRKGLKHGDLAELPVPGGTGNTVGKRTQQFLLQMICQTLYCPKGKQSKIKNKMCLWSWVPSEVFFATLRI